MALEGPPSPGRARSARLAVLLTTLGAACVLLLPAVAAAQLFSPGELAKAHEHLEGLRSCTKCHEAGEKLSNALCLECHAPIAARVRDGRGLHGAASVAQKACSDCHHEHQGRGFDLEALGKPSAFDHGRTGFALKGKHQKVECKDCHDVRLVREEAVKKLLQKGDARSYLGLSAKCDSCHFDEHRGQVSTKCESCHSADAWKPAKGFEHARTHFPLRGKHKKVGCAKCHDKKDDATTPEDAFPKPVSRSFLQLSDVAHASCTACHDDPHDGKLGRRCESCHSADGWDVLARGAKDAGFHDKTEFPLRGGHVGVECKRCHGPFGRKAAVFKNLPFDTCERCHADAHVGQLAEKERACDRCHTVESFLPPTFGVDEHARTSYPLEQAHRAVACDACHEREPALAGRVPAAVRKRLADQSREVVVSLARFDFKKPTDRCESCHADVHLGQFEERVKKGGCGACHTGTSFGELRFDHDKDATFALSGKHAEVACSGCHERGVVPGSNKKAVLYRPLSSACADCHTDVHVGQLKGANEPTTDCARCHDTTSFKEVRFDHQDAAKVRFPLEGRHQEVKCERCHTKISVEPKQEVTRFAPLPQRCAECHLDQHQGAYSAARLTQLMGPAAPAGPGSPCEVCHSSVGWREVTFGAHDQTAFPLRGEHKKVPCEGCHAPGAEKLAVHQCAACHDDPHAGELGARCESCHEATAWAPRFDAAAHRSTSFPLVGSHGLLPCQECHPAAARGFVTAPAECVACHAADYQRTGTSSLDHLASGFSTDCQTCHDAWRFTPARYPGHERCFALEAGPHAGVGCSQCHTAIPSGGSVGACASGTASCTGCHEHSCAQTDPEHRDVPGYQCRDAKCYACHKFAR